MKLPVKYIFSLLVFSNTLWANPPSLEVSTHGNCSPVIETNYGTVNISCNDLEMEKRLNNLPSLQNYNTILLGFKTLEERTNKIGDEIDEANKTQADSGTKLHSLREELNHTKNRVNETRTILNSTRKSLAKSLASIPELVEISINQEVSNKNSLFSLFFEKRLKDTMEPEILALENKLDNYRFNLINVIDRQNKIENNVDILMRGFLDGTLSRNPTFIGISLDGLKLSDDISPIISLEYEQLLPSKSLNSAKFSWFSRISNIEWKRSYNYTTLQGSDHIEITENNVINYLSLGGRVFAPKTKYQAHPYLGASLGISVSGDHDTYIYSLTAGTEFFRKSARISLHLGLIGFTSIQSQVTSFNPLGDSATSVEYQGHSGVYMGMKASFR